MVMEEVGDRVAAGSEDINQSDNLNQYPELDKSLLGLYKSHNSDEPVKGECYEYLRR